MSKATAKEVLGITEFDEVLKSGLENYKDALIKMLELVKEDKEERARIRLNIKAINILLRDHEYVEE